MSTYKVTTFSPPKQPRHRHLPLNFAKSKTEIRNNTSRQIIISLPQAGVDDDGDGAVVDKADFHVGTKAATAYRLS